MDPGERTPSQSPAALGVRDVYGAWKDFAFEATVAAYQPVCEKVIANSEKGVTDKQELVTFVRTFAASVQGKESVPVKEIEGVLSFFKGAFARMMERASYSEAQFNSLFGAVGQLPDPTPMLSKASVLAATVQKLEVELAAASEDGTEAQSLRERLRAEGRAAAAAFAERDAFEALGRKLGGEVEALETAAAAHRQAARETTERNHDLENRYLVVSEELSALQAAREAGGDALQEEVLRLTQQLADRGFEAAALQRRLEAAEAAAETAAAAAGGTAEQALLVHERRWQEELDKSKAEAAAAAAELEQRLASKGRELDEARRSGALLADPAAELEKRRARVRRLVAELGDVGDGCLAQLGAPNAAAASAAGREALAAAEDEVDVVLALKARVKALSAAARTTHAALQAEARAAAAAAEAAAERSRAELAEMEAKVARMRGRLAAIGDPTEAAAAGAGEVGETPAGVSDATAAFDISSLVQDASHVAIDVSGGGAAEQQQPTMVKVLAAQRDALRERVAELEKENHAGRQEQLRLQRLYAGAVDTAGRAAMPLERRVGSPAGPGSVKGKGGASGAAGSLPLLDAFSTKTVQLLNSNLYTRRFAVCYVLLLHLLVSSTLWHAAFSGMSEHTKKSQHSF